MSGYARHLDASKFDFGTNGFKPEQDTARPLFFKKSMLNKETEQLEEYEMVKIVCPGETLNVFVGKVTDDHRMRWPQQYERFQRGEAQADGTPLSQWPEIANDIDLIDQMRAIRINTVEDMANMPDTALRLFHGSMEWRAKAKAFLDKHYKQKASEAAASENAEKDRQIAELRASIEALQKQMVPRKPGRKPKSESAAVAA